MFKSTSSLVAIAALLFCVATAEAQKSDAKDQPASKSEPASADAANDTGEESSSSKRATKSAREKKTRSSKSKQSDDDAIARRLRRLPRNYGKLGLDRQQREKIYSIQADYQQQLSELQAELLKLRMEMGEQVQSVLTKSQREELDQLTKPKTKPVSRKTTTRRKSTRKRN